MWTQIESEIDISRRKILAAIAGASDFTLIRARGNIGDELICAGTRGLLAGLKYREALAHRLEGQGGELALIVGSGAWCQPFQYFAQHLSAVEDRYARVIVLPSTYDISVPFIRQVLSQSKATFFARERVSYEQMRELCRAELAHDGAFFYDYRPYRIPGDGLLLCYRTDEEAPSAPLPPGNNDISVSCESLDEWLWTIARHAEVHTDRSHVMIAAAMLGKRVGYRATTYHKVPAIADFALSSLPVVELGRQCLSERRRAIIQRAETSLAFLPEGAGEGQKIGAVTALLFAPRDIDGLRRSLRALEVQIDLQIKILVPAEKVSTSLRRELNELKGAGERIEICEIDDGNNRAAAITRALERVATPYLLLLEDGLEVMPGALEHLLYALESHPRSSAAAGCVVSPDGVIRSCGGGYRIVDGKLEFDLQGRGQRFEDPSDPSGTCRWAPFTFLLVRTDILREHPLDSEMRAGFEDLEWCYNLDLARAGRFERVTEALAVLPSDGSTEEEGLPISARAPRLWSMLSTLAHFYRKHGLLLPPLFEIFPELGPATNPLAIASGRLLLVLANDCGPAWVIERLVRGELAPIFAVTLAEQSTLRAEIESLREELAGVHERFSAITQTRSWKLLTLHWRLRELARQARIQGRGA